MTEPARNTGNSPPRQRPLRLIAWIAFIGGMLILLALPAHRFEWMLALDPSISTLPHDDSRGARNIVATLVLLLIVAAQGALVLVSRRRNDRLLALVLAVVTTVTWWLRG